MGDLAGSGVVDGGSAKSGDTGSGVVLASYGRGVLVQHGEKTLRCSLRGRKQRIVCGDRVSWTYESANDGASVDAIEPRRNLIERIDSRGRAEPVAANIDRLAIVVAPEPTVDWFLVDRYWAGAELKDVATLLIVNKADLGLDAVRADIAAYRILGLPCLEIAAQSGVGLRELLAALTGALFSGAVPTGALPTGTTTPTHAVLSGAISTGAVPTGAALSGALPTRAVPGSAGPAGAAPAGSVTLLVGQSGVGKSSIVNALVPDAAALISELTRDAEGRHTTTTARWYPLAGGSAIVDAPGVRDFAPPASLVRAAERGFVEIHAHSVDCRFNDCRHMEEPGCAVRAAVTSGAVTARRYESYRRLFRLYEKLTPP